MASEAATITQAVVDDLNGQAWPVTFSAERKYLKPLERERMGDTVYVHAFPLTFDQQKASRNKNSREYGVAVIVRQSVDPAETAGVDDLIETTEKMSDRYQNLKRIGNATVESVEPAGQGGELYDANQLATDRVFVGGIILNLKMTE